VRSIHPPTTGEKWAERMRNARPPTDDDQTRTWDGRVLDTKEKVIEFLAELEEARSTGRSFHPDDNQP